MADSALCAPKVKGRDDLESKFSVARIPSTSVTVPRANAGKSTTNSVICGYYPTNSYQLLAMGMENGPMSGKTVSFSLLRQISGQSYYTYGASVIISEGKVTLSGSITGVKEAYGPMTVTSPELYIMCFL